MSILKKELLYVILASLVVAFFNFQILSTFKELPSPIYGGDLWNHLGSIYHIYYGGSVFENGQMLGEIQWVPWLYHVYVVLLSWFSGLDPMYASIFASLPMIFATAILGYLLVTRFKFSDNALIILAASLLLVRFYPTYKYTDFAFLVIGPAVLLAWMLFLESRTLKRGALLAIVNALGALTSPQLFFSEIILFGVVGINEFYSVYKKSGKFDFSQFTNMQFIESIKPFILIFAAFFILSLPYWFWPIFVYHGATPNNLQIYGWADFSKFGTQISYPLKTLFDTILPFGNIPVLLLGIVQIAGIYAIISRRSEPKFNFLFLALIASIIALFHHLISYNLLGTHFAPERMYWMLQFPLSIVEVAIGAGWLVERFKQNENLIGGACVILVVWSIFISLSGTYAYQWTKAGQQPVPEYLQVVKGWILKNTNVNDVFLTNNEDAFMMNGLTGRKSVTYRRTHAPVYTDMNQRMLDSAVMLYGSNDGKRVELLKKYKVKYLLWTNRWLQNEFAIGNDGRILGFFDPLMVPAKAEYKKYLSDNSIKFSEARTYLDPAARSDYPMYDVIVAMPANPYYDKPWDNGMGARLTELKSIDGITDDGTSVPLVKIYLVDVN